MSDLIQFDFSAHSVRVILRDGNPWFVAADICSAIGLPNTTRALERLDEDEQDLISIQGRENQPLSNFEPKSMNIVNESGLYSLILGSRKPEAKRFKKWVTSEVLPSIRKTGSYTAPTAEDHRPEHTHSVETISRDQYRELRDIVGQISALYHKRGSAGFAAWEGIKQPFGVQNAAHLPQQAYPAVVHHLKEMERISLQFYDLVLKAEALMFRSRFQAKDLPSEEYLSQLSVEQLDQMSLRLH